MKRFSRSLARKLRKIEGKCFPKHDRGLGGADGSSWVYYRPGAYLVIDFDDVDVDVEVLDYASLDRRSGFAVLREFLSDCKAKGWHRVRASLRRVTWENRGILSRFEMAIEYEEEDYVGVVLYP